MKPFIFYLILFTVVHAQTVPQLRMRGCLNITVVDESGKPMPDIQVNGLFDESGKTRRPTQRTNEKGVATLEDYTTNGVGAYVRTSGFYESSFSVFFPDAKNDRFLPWGLEKKLVLRRIESPVPLLAVADWEIEMPRVGKAAFDLEKRSWVEPHGLGKTPDFIFELARSGVSEKGEATLKLTFSNSGDGMVSVQQYHPGGTHLRLPREAPAGGYEPNWREHQRWTEGGSVSEDKLLEQIVEERRRRNQKAPPPVAYFFRVRTVRDEQGNVVRALYGKLLCERVTHDSLKGDIPWEAQHFTQTAKIKLTYYLNPDGSRNLEFDRKRNLFQDIEFQHNPRWP